MWREVIGWTATALFIASYFLDAKALRLVQALAAVLWIIYGVILNAAPVITANALILVVAAFTFFRKKGNASE